MLHDLVRDNQKLAVSQAISIVQEVAKEYGKDGQDPCIGCRYEKRLNAPKCDFCSRPRKDYYEPKKAPYQKGE